TRSIILAPPLLDLARLQISRSPCERSPRHETSRQPRRQNDKARRPWWEATALGDVTRGKLLAVRRHFRLFEHDVLALDRVVLLELELVALRALVLGGVVGKTRTSRRNEANVLSHGTRGVSCAR